jgi:two-component system sensor histidine kinase/response regulator
MTAPATTRRRWRERGVPVVAHADAEPKDLGTCMTGPDSYQMVVELAHDLRSPLTAVLTLTETLRNGDAGPLTDAQRRRLDLIYSAALGLCSTASDAVEFARAGANGAERAVVPFSVDDMLTTVCDMVRPVAESKDIELVLTLPVAGWRSGYGRELSRVMLNLATNAAKFTDAGVVEIGAALLSPSRIEFSVLDTGGGLDPSDRRELYQPFRKAATGSGYFFSSSGLGLAICRKLLRRMGAELHVETVSGAGTRFSFEVELPPANADC